MSWSLSTIIKREDSDEALARSVDGLMQLDRSNVGNTQCIEERDTQINLAIYAAYQLFRDKVFENAEEVGIILSGHANPEHKVASGWANDTITVQVYVKQYRE